MRKVLFYKNYLIKLGLCLSIALSTPIFAEEMNKELSLLKTPAIPLLGIVKLDTTSGYKHLDLSIHEAEIPTILKMYEGLHVLGAKQIKSNSTLWKRVTASKPGFMILPYFQSTLANAALGVSEHAAEADPLNMISMYLEGTLEQAIDEKATAFSVNTTKNKNGFGLLKSTTTNDFSENISTYISVIRIGDEIMKIIDVNSNNNEITVKRGYKKTPSKKHAAGTNIFAPVYRGKRSKGSNPYGTSSRFPNKSDVGSNKVPQYHLRLDSPKAMNLVAIEAKKYIEKGATGLWLDLTGSGLFIPCNALGYKVMPWNFEKNRPYTSRTYADHQDIKCNLLQHFIKQKTGIAPTLVANNHANGKYFRGGMKLVQSTSYKPKPIDGVILEAAFSFYQGDVWFSLNQWKENLSTLIHGAENKYPVWPWIKSVKYAYLPKPNNEKANYFQFFDYTSTLLGYDRGSNIICPIPLYEIDADGNRRFNLPAYLFYDIGEPIDRVGYQDVDKMLIPNTHTYMRKWSKAIVLVNPTQHDDKKITMPEGYIDPKTMQHVSTVSMPAHCGKILLRK